MKWNPYLKEELGKEKQLSKEAMPKPSFVHKILYGKKDSADKNMDLDIGRLAWRYPVQLRTPLGAVRCGKKEIKQVIKEMQCKDSIRGWEQIFI